MCVPMISGVCCDCLFISSNHACSGPWKQVQKYKADSIGSEDMSEPSETQDFRGFYETSRVRPLLYNHLQYSTLIYCDYYYGLTYSTGD